MITTHGDLAIDLVLFASTVTDQRHRANVQAAARIIGEQDKRIETMTVALRTARDRLPPSERALVNQALSLK